MFADEGSQAQEFAVDSVKDRFQEISLPLRKRESAILISVGELEPQPKVRLRLNIKRLPYASVVERPPPAPADGAGPAPAPTAVVGSKMFNKIEGNY